MVSRPERCLVWDNDDDEGPIQSPRRPAKRARVAVACDGKNPCSNCDSFGAHCHYQPSKYRNNKDNDGRSHQQSFKAMQQRLAELEAIVERHGEGAHHASIRSSPISSPRGEGTQDEQSSHCSPFPPQASIQSSFAGNERQGSMQTQNPLLLMLRDLSIGALGEYMGATSQVTMSRIMGSITRSTETRLIVDPGASRDESNGGNAVEGWEYLSPKSASTASKSSLSGKVEIKLSDMPRHMADKLFRGYIHHISTRWPVMHTPYLSHLHENRAFLTDTYELTALHLVYAIGGRFLETMGETGEFYSEQHREFAIHNLDEIIQHHAGLRSIQILILLALYNLRSPKGPGAWTLVGLAMRQCIELGLHRQTRMRWPLIEEMRRRVFWTCYCLDRQVSIILGRPFAISDRDVDAELPSDVEEDIDDEVRLRRIQQGQRESCNVQQPTPKSTSMTGFIYLCRLRMIESEIQQNIYRVDRASPSTIKSDVQCFIAQLEAWRAQMPLDSRSLPNFESMCVDGFDNYMVYYHKCMRFLLFPVILSPDIADTLLLRKCAAACAGVCQTYKKLHQNVPVGFSVMALHSIFIAGLTLLYCTWAAPRDVFSVATSNGLNACSIVMYVIAERWVGARKYRDVFDVIKQAVLELIEAGGEVSRRPIANLRDHVAEALRTAGSGGDEVCCGDFTTLINDMAGGSDGKFSEEHPTIVLDNSRTIVVQQVGDTGTDVDAAAVENGVGMGPSEHGNAQDMRMPAGTMEEICHGMPFETMPLEGMPLGFPSDVEMMMASGSMAPVTPELWESSNHVLI